ncbi:MAG: hypothetical protein HZC38_18890 [Chloroflexi bacterium]|nr:hypothetical protein [Chloroflexota bacterium]
MTNRHIIPLTSIILAATLIIIAWRESSKPAPIALTPTLTNQTEYCLTCHNRIEPISAAHPTEVFGCVRCHGGERLALEKELAHSTMRGGRNPSDFSVVEKSCGGADCHSGTVKDERDHIARVMSSVQATYVGAITNVYFAFGGQPDASPRYGAINISGVDPSGKEIRLIAPPKSENPFLQKFLTNCSSCHLSAKPIEELNFHRLTGCAACHALSNSVGSYVGGDPTIKRGEAGHANTHTLTTAIPYTQCNTCHNRGNYDLRTMTFNARADHPINRQQDYYQPIGQFTKCEFELDCVDCHTTSEVMGDGKIHENKKSSQYVQCQTCHGTLTTLPQTRTIQDVNDVALRRAFLNPKVPLAVGGVTVISAKGEALWNIRKLANGSYQQIGKVSGIKYIVPLVSGSKCQQKPDQQESKYCHECHAVRK